MRRTWFGGLVGAFLLLLAACSPAGQHIQTPVQAKTGHPANETLFAEPALTLTETLPVFTGQWIEVDLDSQTVTLWEDGRVVAEYAMSSGVNTSPETTTDTGIFTIETMYTGPEESSPGVFVKDIVIFDWEHGNGFHSLPMDEEGNVLDSTQGKPATAGCIRMADSAALYQFARVGMKVYIHSSPVAPS